MTEAAWWSGTVRPALVRVLRDRGLPFRIERVENLLGTGMPDVSLTIDGQCLWIENKIRRRGHVKVEPAQPVWHQAHAAAGGRSFVLVRGKRCVEVHYGTDLPWLKDPFARFAQPVDWDAVVDVLLGEVS